MTKIKILTDSACDLPENVIQEYQISVLPFVINLEGQELLDGIDINSKSLANAIRAGKRVSTSQVPQQYLYEYFEHYTAKGIDCVYISFSSKLSGTYQTAQMVAQEVRKNYPATNIQVIDSLSGSLAQGIIVKEAAEWSQNGCTYQQLLINVKEQISKIEHIFSIDDLTHLYKGGRIKLSSAWFGTVMKIKPILHLVDGMIHPLERQRGEKRMLNRIVDLVSEKCGEMGQTIGIAHADDSRKAEALLQKLNQKMGGYNLIVNRIGCVLTVHLGVGGVGVFFKS